MPRYESNAQQEEARRWLDVPVFSAAVLTTPVMIVEAIDAPTGWRVAAVIANWFIWAVFLVDLVTMTTIADKKLRYVKAAWLDLLIVITSFPLLTTFGVLRLARLGRLGPVLRILRLARLAAVMNRGSTAAKKVFGRKGFAYVAVVTLFLVIGFAVAATLIDPEIETIDQGLWWSVVTITTVGYGDLTPSSTAGRITGAVLMFIGIGVVGVVTGLVASVVLDESEETAEINERLIRIEDLLEAFAESTDASDARGSDD